MKSSTVTTLVLALAIAATGASSTAFAKPHAGKVHGHNAQDTLVNRPFNPSSGDNTCTFALDYRCPTN